MLTRREFLVAGAGSAGVLALPARTLYGNPLLFIGGLVLGDIILGVLRAYDINMGQTAEDVVRCFRECRHARRIRCNGTCGDVVITDRGSSRSGYMQVDTEGYSVARRLPRVEEPMGFWVPGPILYAAVGDSGLADSRDLEGRRCGYPRDHHEAKRYRDRVQLKQTFEAGAAEIVLRASAVYSPAEGLHRLPSEMILDLKWKSGA